MKNGAVYFGTSILMFLMMNSCQKDLLQNPLTDKTLKIPNDSVTQTFVLNSSPSAINTQISSFLKTFTSSGGDNELFTIQSGSSWNIISYPTWISFNNLSGNGSANVIATVQTNTGAQRMGTITIAGSGVTNPLTINALQLASSTAPGSVSVNYLKTFSATAGDHGYFILSSNTSWRVVSYPSWTTVSSLSGTGNAHITVTVQANTGPQRTGTITISGTGVSQNVSVNALQVAGASSVAVTPPPPPPDTTTKYYYPFTSLGYTIINKYLLAPSSVTTTGDLITTNGTMDIEQCYLESDDPNINALIYATGATSATSIKFMNNVFVSDNHTGYNVIAGTDAPPPQTGLYNGAQFIGNSLTGVGSGNASYTTHGLFLSFSAGGTWKYNFVQNNPYGLQTKADGLDNSIGGSISYNLVKNPIQGVAIKGITNTLVYNNTIYMDNSVLNYAVGVHICEYDDGTHPSTGTVIMNNIIYSTGTSPFMIQFDDYASLGGLQCDYNVYYVAGGTPEFIYVDSNGNTQYATFSQWQALGYDTHSIVINPNLDPNTLIPASPLYYGTNLGSNYNLGIDPSNVWNRNATITKTQGSSWENGAFIK